MNLKRLTNALAKAGATITRSDYRTDYYFAHKPGCDTVSWYTEGEGDKARATCVSTSSPHTDIMTDCFCDRFFHTIKSVAYNFSKGAN